MKPVEIAKGIYDVGVIDWTIRDFHGYSTHMGTSYNAFLVVGEKIVLIDTVKKSFADQLLRNIARIVDPAKIDVVISNHTEMDHTGALPYILSKVGKETPVYCSGMGKRTSPGTFRSPSTSRRSRRARISYWETGPSASSKPGCSTGRTACSPT